MATVIKYVGNGAFINGLPARDLDEEDWQVIGTQGRQREVLESDLYKVVGAISLTGSEEEMEGTLLPSISKDIDEALAAGGFMTVEAVNAASDEELLALDGIGSAKLKDIRAAVAQSMASDIE